MLKAGTRYNLVSTLDGSTPGFLLDNLYYEGGGVVGELKDGTFLYYMDIDAKGTPRYPENIAGRLEGNEIVRALHRKSCAQK